MLLRFSLNKQIENNSWKTNNIFKKNLTVLVSHKIIYDACNWFTRLEKQTLTPLRKKIRVRALAPGLIKRSRRVRVRGSARSREKEPKNLPIRGEKSSPRAKLPARNNTLPD